MKYLIIYCHPNPKSFTHAITETLKEALEGRSDGVRVRDLYEMNFDPILKGSELADLEAGKGVAPDVATEQEHIQWANRVIIIYPLWWQGLPAILKGYVDRVFTLNFAYAFDENGPKGLLTDKKVYFMTTMGAELGVYEKIGLFASMKQTIADGITGYCGMECVGHKYFGAVPLVSDEVRKGMLEEVKQIAVDIS